MVTTAIQLDQRLSTAPSPREDKYAEIKTPEALEGGALRPGGPPDLYSRHHIGLLAQYAAIGVVYGTLWGVSYPLLNNYFHMSGVETASADALLALPWAWKMFFGIISDCYPIFGYRRRPYIVIGWLLACIPCIIMALTPVGEPYYPDPEWSYVLESELSTEQLAQLNTDAPANGVKYVVLLALANIGCVIALTASDGILIELGQREPENVRGTAQTMICVSQNMFGCFSATMIGFGLNSKQYGGSWDWDIGFNTIMGVCAVASLVIIPISWLCITEDKVTQHQSARKIVASIYDFIQLRVVYELIAFRFFRNLFAAFSVTARYPIQSTWAKVETLNDQAATLLGYLLSAGAWWAMKQYGLHWNWRTVMVVTQLFVVALDSIPTFFTIWDVYRAQWFWLGGPLLQNLPYSVGYVVTTFAAMEIIDVGNEASVYGLISTVSTVASPFSTVLTKNVDAHFDIGFEALQTDDTRARQQVTYAYLIAYAFNLFSLVFLVWLPRQKKECHELKATGGRSKLLGILTIVYLLFALGWSMMTNAMSFSSATSCLTIAGGDGCDTVE